MNQKKDQEIWSRRKLLTKSFVISVDEDQSTSQDVEAASSTTEDVRLKVSIDAAPETNGHQPHRKVLQRIETVPDIKKDTSGITTQYIATGIGNFRVMIDAALFEINLLFHAIFVFICLLRQPTSYTLIRCFETNLKII